MTFLIFSAPTNRETLFLCNANEYMSKKGGITKNGTLAFYIGKYGGWTDCNGS